VALVSVFFTAGFFFAGAALALALAGFFFVALSVVFFFVAILLGPIIHPKGIYARWLRRFG
jgi:hypothetical protein